MSFFRDKAWDLEIVAVEQEKDILLPVELTCSPTHRAMKVIRVVCNPQLLPGQHLRSPGCLLSLGISVKIYRRHLETWIFQVFPIKCEQNLEKTHF